MRSKSTTCSPHCQPKKALDLSNPVYINTSSGMKVLKSHMSISEIPNNCLKPENPITPLSKIIVPSSPAPSTTCSTMSPLASLGSNQPSLLSGSQSLVTQFTLIVAVAALLKLCPCSCKQSPVPHLNSAWASLVMARPMQFQSVTVTLSPVTSWG